MKNTFQIFYLIALLFTFFFSSCEQEVDGCTDANACNYNNEATNDDNSCQIPIDDVLEITYLDTVVSGAVGEDLIAHVHIRNSSCNPVSVKARKVYNGPEETSAYFCFAGVCFSSSTIESPLALSLDVFEEDDYFKGYLTSDVPGIYSVTYRFYIQDNPSESTEVVIDYEVN